MEKKKKIKILVRIESDSDVSTEPYENAQKNAQKSSKNFKPSIRNVVYSTGTNFAK